MFGPRIHLLTVWGIPIGFDLSWLVIVVLITWSLAEGLFANLHVHPTIDEAQAEAMREAVGMRWLLGLLGALGLFLSVVLHELGHAKVAERFGVPMAGITLFIFGGVAEMTREPPSAKAEFWVAIGGPLVTVALAFVGAVAVVVMGMADAGVGPSVLVGWLTLINVVLLVFNMIPAFPLDGGRVLRSIIWAASGDLHKATRITSAIGSGFGMFLMVFAVVQLLFGNVIGAIWMFLIGMFLRAAAQMSYQRLVARRALEGERLDRFMKTDPITLTPDLPLDRVVDDYLYRYHYKMFPVVEQNDRLVGCLTIEQIKDVPREQWPVTYVRDVLQTCGPNNTIARDKDPLDALTAMTQDNRTRLMVLDGDRLVGVIAMKDLMEFLSLKIELEP